MKPLSINPVSDTEFLDPDARPAKSKAYNPVSDTDFLRRLPFLLPIAARLGTKLGTVTNFRAQEETAGSASEKLVTVPIFWRLPFLLLVAAGLALAAKGALIPAKAIAAQMLLERAFAEGLASGRPVRAWSWADTAPVARLTVPRLGAADIILSGGSGEALAFGPTHLPASAPLGADSGTAVLAAHRDTHFRFLKDLRPGDEIRVETLDGRTLRYRVAGARIVRRDSYAPSGDLALVTCWPFGGTARGPLRYVVTALRLN
jgi:sortase A